MQVLRTSPRPGHYALDLHCDACGAQFVGPTADRPYRAESNGRSLARAAGWHVHNVRVVVERSGAGYGIYTAHYCPACHGGAAACCDICRHTDGDAGMLTARMSDLDMGAWSAQIAAILGREPLVKAPDAVCIAALCCVLQERDVAPISAGA